MPAADDPAPEATAGPSTAAPCDGVPDVDPPPAGCRSTPRLDPYSWLVTGVVVAIAAILRLASGWPSPKGKIFDEIYYANDA